MMTEQQEKILLHWIEKICRKCDEQGIEYGIFVKSDTVSWTTNIDKFLTCNADHIKLNQSYLSHSDINILRFHEGPKDSRWNYTYSVENPEYKYWEIPFTALLDPQFHTAFDAEFEYRKFNYLFGVEHDNY